MKNKIRILAVCLIAALGLGLLVSCGADTHTHDYRETQRLAPSCEEEGYVLTACDCGGEQTEALAPLGHTPGEWEVTQEASSTAPGLREQHCTVCGAVTDSETIPEETAPEETTEPAEEKEKDEKKEENKKEEDKKEENKKEEDKKEEEDNREENGEKKEENTTPGGIGGHTHTYTRSVQEEATCLRDGAVKYSCQCGSSYLETLPRLDHQSVPVVTEGGCTEDTVEEQICTLCGQVISAEVIREAPGHDFQCKEKQEPACTEAGFQVSECTRCGETSRLELPALGHSYRTTEQTAPTCDREGRVTKTCENCGDTVAETVPAAGHQWTEQQVIAPTCEEEGYTLYVCAHDQSHTKKDDVVPALGHGEIRKNTAKSATCTQEGLEQELCGRCGKVLGTKTLPKADHSYQEVDRQNATCWAEGYADYVCRNQGCGETKREVLGELSHHYLETERQEAACTEPGFVRSQCPNCQDVSEEILAPLGHAYAPAGHKDPTCTGEGWDEWVCTRCGDSYRDPLAKTPHDHTVTGRQDPACMEEGWDEYTCLGCGDSYTQPIPAAGHDFRLTGDNGHVKTYACTRCGESYGEIYGENHHYQQTDKQEPTCTQAGSVTYTCQDCGESCTETLPMTAHSGTAAAVSEPTCTQEGLRVTKCVHCGQELSREAIPCLPHRLETEVKQEPTCAREGQQVTRCAVCGGQETVTAIPALPHTLHTVTTQEPTCTQAGEQAVTCTVCGQVNERTPLDPLGHAHEAVNTTAPTCTQDGSVTYACSRCGDSYEETIPMLGHDYAVTERVDPTCTEGGRVTDTCARCRDSRVEELPALGHAYTSTVRSATCVRRETTLYTCQTCGNTYEEVTGGYAEHQFRETDRREAACTQEGQVEYTCLVCQEKKTETLAPAGHNRQMVQEIPGTCVREGRREYVCLTCGETYTEKLDPLGHVPSDWVVVFEPTDTQPGLREKRCIRCNMPTEQESIPVPDSVDQAFTIDMGNGETATVWGHIDYGMEAEIFRLLNEYRAENGLAELKASDSLSQGANIRGPELAVSFSHTRPNGSSCFTVAANAKGENIASQYASAESVMQGWKNSPGHNANMLKTSYQAAGIGVFAERVETSPGRYYYRYHYVQLFGRA